MEQDEEISSELEAAGLEFEYFAKWNLYALRLREGDVEKNKEVIEKFIRKAFEINQG